MSNFVTPTKRRPTTANLNRTPINTFARNIPSLMMSPQLNRRPTLPLANWEKKNINKEMKYFDNDLKNKRSKYYYNQERLNNFKKATPVILPTNRSTKRRKITGGKNRTRRSRK